MWSSSTVSDEENQCSTEGRDEPAVVGMTSPRSHSVFMEFKEPSGERRGAHV